MCRDDVLVSVVVPVYKVEKYLDRCVKSLLNQTLKNIEIILVDDGSPDKCPQMCDKYEEVYSNIRVVHKKNGGLSSARNAGIKVACGKYITFVDSDDDVELNMYERMANKAEEFKADFVMSDYIRINQDGSRYLKSINMDEGYYDKNKIKKDIYPKLIMTEEIEYGPLLSVWHCMYKTEFIFKNNLLFDEEVRWSEDNIFSAMVGYQAKNFYYMKGEGLYHYYQNPGTITTSYRKGAWGVYKTMNRHLESYFEDKVDYDFTRQLKLHMIFYACNCIGQSYMLDKKNTLRDISNILNSEELKSAFYHFSLPNVHVKLKIQLFLMKHRMTKVLYYALKG